MKYFFYVLAIFCGVALGMYGVELEQSDEVCGPNLIASIHRCDAAGCLVLLPDGTKGMARKWPVEFAKMTEVCK